MRDTSLCDMMQDEVTGHGFGVQSLDLTILLYRHAPGTRPLQTDWLGVISDGGLTEHPLLAPLMRGTPGATCDHTENAWLSSLKAQVGLAGPGVQRPVRPFRTDSCRARIRSVTPSSTTLKVLPGELALLNANVAPVPVVGFDGPLLMVVCGARVSIVHMTLAAVVSRLPA